MREIRRAAVSGLFALWLAPLPALAGGLPSNVPACCAPSTSTGAPLSSEEAGRTGALREEEAGSATEREGEAA